MRLRGGSILAKNRVPLQVHPLFKEELKKLQINMSKVGRDMSLRDLTGEFVNSGILTELEKRILNKKELKIRFDGRW